MNESETWTCPTCHATVSTPFCPECGERSPRERDLTLGGIFNQLVQALTQVDGKLILSFRRLVTRPGSLTLAYIQGQRKPYVGPVSLFLIANALFFAIESWTGGTIFTTPLDSHLHTQPWSDVARRWVPRRLESMQTTLGAYAPIFDRAMARNARSLIVLMALCFIAAPAIAFYRSKRPLGAHAVFSLHVYSFLLLLLSVATLIPPVDLWFGGAGFRSESLDDTISIALMLVCGLYVHVAIGAVYGATGASRVFKAAALTVAVAAIVLGYRFVLFVLTLYTT